MAFSIYVLKKFSTINRRATSLFILLIHDAAISPPGFLIAHETKGTSLKNTENQLEHPE